VAFDKDKTLQDYIMKDKSMPVEIYIVWKRGYSVDAKPEDLYADWLKSGSATEMVSD
jgi:hypothetical protein